MTTAAILAASGSPGTTTGFKNRIINGAMVIDQRNAGASVSLPDGAASGAYPVDRYYCSRATGATATGQQSSSAPAGFINSFVITNGTGISVGASGQGYIIQFIEGLNCTDLAWGTANAKTVTISFWVQSSITGTHSGALFNSAFNRSYPFSYTISSANTWTQVSVTIPGDTSGTWLTTNGRGIAVCFNNGSGSTYLGTAGAWAGSGLYGVTGSVALNSVTGSTWYLTGLQFEVGTTATNFDFRSYGTELALCQRYFQNGITSQSECIIGGIRTGGAAQFSYPFKVTMRSTPSITLNSFTAQDLSNGSNYTVTGLAMQNGQTATNNINMSATWSSGGTAGVAANLFGPSNATGFTFSAEL